LKYFLEADDTLVILQADTSQLICLKAILHSFAESTRLEVNYNKYSMMPINMDEARLIHFSNTIHCTKRKPSIYLLGRLPLGITKPSLEYFLPMAQRVERRLCGIVDFMDYGGKTSHHQISSSLPIFFMACLNIPFSIKDQVIKYMRHC
jgi:hypothetical protein